MGAVVMNERSTGLVDKGYPVTEATLYIYCDACGSFNIKTYIPLYKLFIIALIVTAIVFLSSENTQWLMCLVPLGLISLFLPWKDIMLKYKCRKCRNVHISDFNALKYQPYDLSQVDIADGQTQKRYIDTDVLHFQQFT